MLRQAFGYREGAPKAKDKQYEQAEQGKRREHIIPR